MAHAKAKSIGILVPDVPAPRLRKLWQSKTLYRRARVFGIPISTISTQIVHVWVASSARASLCSKSWYECLVCFPQEHTVVRKGYRSSSGVQQLHSQKSVRSHIAGKIISQFLFPKNHGLLFSFGVTFELKLNQQNRFMLLYRNRSVEKLNHKLNRSTWFNRWHLHRMRHACFPVDHSTNF